MSSSQAQRQERLQARLRGAGNTAFSGGFNFGLSLPEEPSPQREPAQPPLPPPSTELPPPPPPPPKERTPRRPTPKQTPPTRASPRLSTGPVETPSQRSTRSASRLSDAASSQQQSVRSSTQRSSGQKRKQAAITQDETPLQRVSTAVMAVESTTLETLLSSPVPEASRRAAAVAAVTPQTRGQRRRQPSPDKFLTPGDGVATRLFGMESGARSNGFINPSRGNAFQELAGEANDGGEDEDDDEVLLNTASIIEEILDNLAEEEEVEHEAGEDAVMEDGLEELNGDEEQEVEADEEEQDDEGEASADEEQEEQVGEESPIKTAITPGNKKRRKVVPQTPAEEQEEEEPTPNPTPKPQTRPQKPAPQQAPAKPSKSAPPRRRETIEITVHRLSKSKKSAQNLPRASIPPINPLDVLSQIFKEMLKKQYEKLDSPVAKLALEVFADEVEVRLLEHTDTLNTTLQTARELKRYQKVKQEKREELMALRMELGKVEGEIDEVRRKFDRDSRESKSKHSISQRLETIAATLDLRRAHITANPNPSTPELEGSVDLLLRKLSSEVTSSRRRRIKLEDDLEDLEEGEEDMDEIFEEEMGAGGDGLETGSILERVRGFNRFLERAEKVVREAHARRTGEGR